VFPHYDRPRVVWWVSHRNRRSSCCSTAWSRSSRRWFPDGGSGLPAAYHAGRAGSAASPRRFDQLEAALADLRFDATAVIMTVDLMESALQSGGAVYHVRHSERLS